MKHKSIIRRQRPIPGGRESLPSCVIREIQRAVENEASRNNVSKSFVIAVALAHFFGIKEQESFYQTTKLKVVNRR